MDIQEIKQNPLSERFQSSMNELLVSWLFQIIITLTLCHKKKEEK